MFGTYKYIALLNHCNDTTKTGRALNTYNTEHVCTTTKQNIHVCKNLKHLIHYYKKCNSCMYVVAVQLKLQARNYTCIHPVQTRHIEHFNAVAGLQRIHDGFYSLFFDTIICNYNIITVTLQHTENHHKRDIFFSRMHTCIVPYMYMNMHCRYML